MFGIRSITLQMLALSLAFVAPLAASMERRTALVEETTLTRHTTAVDFHPLYHHHPTVVLPLFGEVPFAHPKVGALLSQLTKKDKQTINHFFVVADILIKGKESDHLLQLPLRWDKTKERITFLKEGKRGKNTPILDIASRRYEEGEGIVRGVNIYYLSTDKHASLPYFHSEVLFFSLLKRNPQLFSALQSLTDEKSVLSIRIAYHSSLDACDKCYGLFEKHTIRPYVTKLAEDFHQTFVAHHPCKKSAYVLCKKDAALAICFDKVAQTFKRKEGATPITSDPQVVALYSLPTTTLLIHLIHVDVVSLNGIAMEMKGIEKEGSALLGRVKSMCSPVGLPSVQCFFFHFLILTITSVTLAFLLPVTSGLVFFH